MTNLSRLRTHTAQAVPRNIALWKDPIEGTVAIDLPSGCTAAIITMVQHETPELTADGRSNVLKQGAPVFGGVQFL
jgi:hypothetical protein